MVRDNGFPPQESFRRIIVNLTDIDDSLPSFYDCAEVNTLHTCCQWHILMLDFWLLWSCQPSHTCQGLHVCFRSKTCQNRSWYGFPLCLQPLLSNPVIAHVLEEQEPPVSVTRVQACDLDSPPNNMVYYFLVGECPLPTIPPMNRKSDIWDVA